MDVKKRGKSGFLNVLQLWNKTFSYFCIIQKQEWSYTIGIKLI